MNTYEVLYFRGYDHDDWNKLTVTAYTEVEAKSKAQDAVPRGCRVKKIKLIQTSADTRTKPCNMAQANITRIEPANPPTWQGSHGTMYAFDVDLSDGTQGSVNTKSPNKWKVGDAVEYTAQSTHHGTKLKLDKPGFSGGGFTAKSGGNDDATKGIIASWAVGIAMQVADRDAQNYDVQVMQYARLALEARATIKNEVRP
jgi:hypothetical protein